MNQTRTRIAIQNKDSLLLVFLFAPYFLLLGYSTNGVIYFFRVLYEQLWDVDFFLRNTIPYLATIFVSAILLAALSVNINWIGSRGVPARVIIMCSSWLICILTIFAIEGTK